MQRLLALALLASACTPPATVAPPPQTPAPTPALSAPASPTAPTPEAPVEPASPTPSSDPIDRLVTHLNGTGGLWVNGVMPSIRLPATATPDEVVTAALRGYDGLHTSHVVLVRHVEFEVGDVRDTAALVDTNLGQRIVLMGYDASIGWETKVFDAASY